MYIVMLLQVPFCLSQTLPWTAGIYLFFARRPVCPAPRSGGQRGGPGEGSLHTEQLHYQRAPQSSEGGGGGGGEGGEGIHCWYTVIMYVYK